jgi:organic radical activating enzyme
MANIAILNYCNLKCEYCFADDMIHEESSAVTLEDFQKILEFTAKVPGMNHIGIIGGEPTLHPQFDEILKEVNSTTELKDKQAAAVATVLLGDELSNRIFSDDLLTIDDIIEVLPKENNVDLSERSYNIINDWIGQNINKFKNNDNNEIYGKINTVMDECFVIFKIIFCFFNENFLNFF